MLLLALAVPCSAQLGIITGVLAKITATGALLYVGVILGCLFAMGWAAARVLPGAPADLLLEVPPFRLPSVRNVLVKTFYRVKWFLGEAVPLFLIGTACLFVAQETGVLRVLEAGAQPVVSGILGLPPETAQGFIMGFLRRDYGAVIIFQQFNTGGIGPSQALVALVVVTLFVPCLAHFFVCIKEMGLRRAVFMNIVVFTTAILVGGFVRVFLAATHLMG